MQRTRNPEPNVEKVFWNGSGLSKLTLADALWPVLEKRIDVAIRRGHHGPLVMRAYEMASISEHWPVILRRRESRRRRHFTPGVVPGPRKKARDPGRGATTTAGAASGPPGTR